MSRSQDLFAEAQKHIPGGVNSPVRAFRAVGGEPVFFKRASGAYLYDEDDNAYVDYVGSGVRWCLATHIQKSSPPSKPRLIMA